MSPRLRRTTRPPATSEIAVRPSPLPRPRPTPRTITTVEPAWAEPLPAVPGSSEAEVFAAFPAAVAARNPIQAGGLVWETDDAETSPIGWELAQELGTPLSGYWMALWELTQKRNEIAAEMAAL
jgi:hypothetical protein